MCASVFSNSGRKPGARPNDDAIELLLLERKEVAARGDDARIVDEDVHALEGIGRRADEIAHIEPLADIAIAEDRLSAAVGDLGGNLLARFFVDVGKDKLCAFIRESMCDGAADAVRRACHDRYLAAELGTGCHEITPSRGRGRYSTCGAAMGERRLLPRAQLVDRDIWGGGSPVSQ